jgi:hypothetical protein
MPKDLRNSPKVPARTKTEDADALRHVPISPGEVAQYIAEFSAELSSLAREAKLEFVAYLLDMVRMEAAAATGRARPER